MIYNYTALAISHDSIINPSLTYMQYHHPSHLANKYRVHEFGMNVGGWLTAAKSEMGYKLGSPVT